MPRTFANSFVISQLEIKTIVSRWIHRAVATSKAHAHTHTYAACQRQRCFLVRNNVYAYTTYTGSRLFVHDCTTSKARIFVLASGKNNSCITTERDNYNLTAKVCIEMIQNKNPLESNQRARFHHLSECVCLFPLTKTLRQSWSQRFSVKKFSRRRRARRKNPQLPTNSVYISECKIQWCHTLEGCFPGCSAVGK